MQHYSLLLKFGSTQLSTDGKMNKVWYVHAMKHYSALNTKKILTHVTIWINLEDIMQSGKKKPATRG